MEIHTGKTVKTGNVYKLLPYKHPYLLAASERLGNVQYSVVNLDLGVVIAEFPTVGKVCTFLNDWKAVQVSVKVVEVG
jgi:hypothetical protein